jgi:hypothetical protein
MLAERQAKLTVCGHEFVGRNLPGHHPHRGGIRGLSNKNGLTAKNIEQIFDAAMGCVRNKEMNKAAKRHGEQCYNRFQGLRAPNSAGDITACAIDLSRDLSCNRGADRVERVIFQLIAQ